jgi:hypothetical protein
VKQNVSSSIKLRLSNDGDSEVKMKAGTILVQALILHAVHPTLVHKGTDFGHPSGMTDRVATGTVHSSSMEVSDAPEPEDESDSSLITSLNGVTGSSKPIKEIELRCLPTSYVHMMLDDKSPSCLHVAEINVSICLPHDIECKNSTIEELAQFSQSLEENIPLPHPNPDTESLIQIYPKDGMKDAVQLNSTESAQTCHSSMEDSDLSLAEKSAYNSICEKLAVVSVDLIQNGCMSRCMLAQLQQGDDYLGPLRDELGKRKDSFPKYFIKDMILYKKFMPKHSLSEKHVLCLPDVLLPAVIHFLHVTLGHSSVTLTRRNFEHYYQNRNAHRIIAQYVQSCVTCAMAQKYDIKKVIPQMTRSLQPTRPRQYMYCDLIPMPGKVYTYILFCLDAYSQYVYALPLRDKTSGSVIQAFLSLFSSTGWPEAIYLDNETSFQKSAKFLVRHAPVKVFYSVPYCQFQNWSENYIKSFKKTLSKILHDIATPHNNEDWPMLLPTVTQSLNRQIIPDLGLTRESIHFNMNVEFHPLANLGSEHEKLLNDEVQPIPSNLFKNILERRLRNRKVSKRNPVPHFHETQIVFLRDQAPSVSSILKTPNKGPFRIDKLEERDVVLTDLSSGKTVHSHVQFVRPLELSEYRLLLSKNWDLNANSQRAGMPALKPGIFDAPLMPFPVEIIREKENLYDFPEEGLMENIFQTPASGMVNPTSEADVLVNPTFDINGMVNSTPATSLGNSTPKTDGLVNFTQNTDGLVNSTPEVGLVPEAPQPPDYGLERDTAPLRRSPRFSQNDSAGLFSVQNILSMERDMETAEEIILGEQNISFNAVNVSLDMSKLYKQSLGQGPSEIESPKILETEVEEINSPLHKSALKKKRSISFFIPELSPYLLYPEKDLEMGE